MPVTFILDTDMLTLFQYGNQKVVEKVSTSGADRVWTTIITAREQIQARLGKITEAEVPLERKKLTLEYRRFHETILAFRKMQVLDYTEAAEDCYQRLRARLSKAKASPLDLQIASIALQHGATVVTGNRSHFEAIPNLKATVDWSM
jgi:tRNA(fMet)-specific endonuclease VapC